MDLNNAYWQIEIDERDLANTAFFTTDILCEFKSVPFRLCTASATFQRVVFTVLGGHKWKTYIVCLDYVVMFSSSALEYFVVFSGQRS